MFRDASLVERGKWKDSDKLSLIVNNGLKLFSAGMLCTSAVSIIVFRSMAARVSAMCLGAGWGIGNAYVDSQFILGQEVSAVQVRYAEVVKKVEG